MLMVLYMRFPLMLLQAWWLLGIIVSGCSVMRMSLLELGCLQWMSTTRIIMDCVRQTAHPHPLLYGIFQSVQASVTLKRKCSNSIKKRAAQKALHWNLMSSICAHIYIAKFRSYWRNCMLLYDTALRWDATAVIIFYQMIIFISIHLLPAWKRAILFFPFSWFSSYFFLNFLMGVKGEMKGLIWGRFCVEHTKRDRLASSS